MTYGITSPDEMNASGHGLQQIVAVPVPMQRQRLADRHDAIHALAVDAAHPVAQLRELEAEVAQRLVPAVDQRYELVDMGDGGLEEQAATAVLEGEPLQMLEVETGQLVAAPAETSHPPRGDGTVRERERLEGSGGLGDVALAGNDLGERGRGAGARLVARRRRPGPDKQSGGRTAELGETVGIVVETPGELRPAIGRQGAHCAG